jgi:hypothetical protein
MSWIGSDSDSNFFHDLRLPEAQFLVKRGQEGTHFLCLYLSVCIIFLSLLFSGMYLSEQNTMFKKKLNEGSSIL